MIIKSCRIPTARTGAIANYLSREPGTDATYWLRGEPHDISLMGLAAKTAGTVYSVRHIVIAPEVAMDDVAIEQALQAIQTEYAVSDLSMSQACLVRHRQCRTGQGKSPPHFHLALPEYDLATERVMSSRFTRIRDEKLARLLEITLGHPVHVGRFNREVYKAICADHPGVDLRAYHDALRKAAVSVVSVFGTTGGLN